MNVNDIGNWCVVWLVGPRWGRSPQLVHAFFNRRDDALSFIRDVGGELYTKHADGTLKRA